MKTEHLMVDPARPDRNIIQMAANRLKAGGLVAFPTETVYGLGGNGLDETAVHRIYAAKGRPSDNPLILHISDLAQLYELATDISDNALRLTQALWPGPLTVVVKRSSIVPDTITAGGPTVAVRMPDHPVGGLLLQLTGLPIAAPSANLSGKPSPTDAQSVMNDLDGRIDMILDGGPCGVGVESTVVDCSVEIPTVLRPGGITLEQLQAVVGTVAVDPGLIRQGVAAKSPGMKYRHYAPQAPLLIVDGHPDAVAERLVILVNEQHHLQRKVGLLVTRECQNLRADVVQVMGSRDNPAEIAHNLFACLRSFDAAGVDVIYAEAVGEAGMGLAVMNRLRKSAGGRIIQA